MSSDVAPAAWSTSGGKDSMLAMLRAREAGVTVGTMLSMADETGLRNRSHGIPKAILQAQAAALGLQLLLPCASWADYEAVFVGALQTLAARGVRNMVFGDIDLQAHRDWEEAVCAKAGMTALLPLWGEDRLRLAHEVLERGIRAVVVCVDSRHLDDSFCGREYDAAFIADLPAGVCPCGENGEFHTFVFDAPAMSHALAVSVTQRREYVSPPQYGSQRYCFADLSLD
jgi:uncharacterized protein (TIGR00290 family)